MDELTRDHLEADPDKTCGIQCNEFSPGDVRECGDDAITDCNNPECNLPICVSHVMPYPHGDFCSEECAEACEA